MCVLVDALTWLDTSNLKSDMQVRFPSFVWFLLGVRWDQLIAHPFLNMLAAVWEHVYSSWQTMLTETASSILNRYRCGIITQKRSFCVMSCLQICHISYLLNIGNLGLHERLCLLQMLCGCVWQCDQKIKSICFYTYICYIYSYWLTLDIFEIFNSICCLHI